MFCHEVRLQHALPFVCQSERSMRCGHWAYAWVKRLQSEDASLVYNCRRTA